ncbi:MAG: hypothetical protein J5871_04845 [Bacteroidales bacterium]|nr:hypothetical protein [Bacteroidales bacterium]
MLAAACCSCQKGGGSTPPVPAFDPETFVHFYFADAYVGLRPGEQRPLDIRCHGASYDREANLAEMLYGSSAPEVVSVSDDGVLTAHAPGCAVIRATSVNSETQQLPVRVFPEDFVRYQNPTGDRLPVLGWYSLMPPNITRENYRTMAEAGFNLSFSHIWSRAENLAALDAADGTGISLMLMDLDANRTNLPDVAQAYRSHPAFAGYWLYDEPSVAQIGELNAWNTALRSADREHFTYVNLLPDYSSTRLWGCSGFYEYFSRAASELNVNFLSFDYYPVMNGTMRRSFYSCYETVKSLCDAHALPFWAFGMSCQHRTYDRPGEANLKFEIYTALAYGAQGIQYFTYQTPVGTVEPFGIAPVDAEGRTTEVYACVQRINAELSAIGHLFLGASSVRRMFLGELPAGMTGFSYHPAKLPAPVTGVSADGEGVLLSHLCNGEREYLMLVNRSFSAAQTITLDFSGTLERILPDGRTEPASRSVPLPAGDMLLYRTR